jgi:hypothetical protein
MRDTGTDLCAGIVSYLLSLPRFCRNVNHNPEGRFQVKFYKVMSTRYRFELADKLPPYFGETINALNNPG